MTCDIYEAITILGVTRQMVYKMIHSGRLTPVSGQRTTGRPGPKGPVFDREEVQRVADLRRPKLGVDNSAAA
jgi:hypothetical protein